MKRITLLFLMLFSIISLGQVTITPNPFEVDQSITITVDINSSATDCNGINNPSKVYLHSGIGDDNDPWGFNVVGNWGQDDGIGEMTNNGNGTWSITFVPETYYNLSTTQAQNAIKMGMVFRNADGTQELKASGCSDFFFDVGTFQVSLSSPAEDSTTIINSGNNFSVSASNIGGPADYVLKSNGNIINTQNSVSTYNYTQTNITNNQNYVLEVTLNGTTIFKEFSAIVDPGTVYEVMPTNYQDGITYLSDTEAVLVLYATGKDFVYLAGSFNNWQPDSNYAMKVDPTRNNKFWITLTGLTPGQIETYQYWVVDKTPPANSPSLVKTADPYSTLVLSPFDDPWIPAASYPNLPAYPAGQEREVTVLQTAQTPYNWQVINFTKPKKEDLIVYKLLVRDFDADRNYQDVIDKIDYFKSLNINAIELMPVMEFEGNESWGYNTSFHMALDKFYGTEDKLKELIDVCHQNGIAVILDLALNHAFGRNPMVRMWMNDPDGDGWGEPNSQNPYFNVTPTHTYNVGYDFDHSNPRTKDYTKSVIKHWIEEFHIDGFRWDLTKGFTQNCTSGDEGCTNSYQQDRVDVLREYVDYSWSLDPYHYAIFEHLGSDSEEQQWANYRIGETIPKGVMMWKEMWNDYKNLGKGNAANISGIGSNEYGFTMKRALGYPESHDKDRIMYEMVTFGASNGSYDITDLNTALTRMSTIGATSIMIPGPKMLWHFGELGMDISIWTCDNGVVNTDYDGNNDGDCKLSTKPQPQWANNWTSDPNRSQVFSDWARLNDLKINEDVFEGDYSIDSGDLTPRIFIWNDAIPATELKNVVILANFDLTAQNIVPDFPYTGTWYDLMDETNSTSINVTNTTATINIPAGEFRIFGNAAPQSLSTTSFNVEDSIKLYPNPTKTTFSVNIKLNNVSIIDVSGKEIKSFNGDFEKGHTFNVEGISKGLYLIQLENENGQSSTQKLIIN
ncbi:alpha-amylase family glycosyl hydrolase [Mesoflavibacter zeaxanthinifaciens]|uniref:alpha-amylase family glycosyl hydrolase n=1 Tax=Mesoflavibacter zeaxanthinifaciens TaxID=393060 RepID=UPI0026ED7145|nr:alpha-amylase family glycosyl hydrolase [Mesoflavibacter zeaxanthinifaciens]